MKILYIKAGNIFENSGGGIESQKIYHSITRLVREEKGIEFKCISTDEDIESNYKLQSINKSKLKDYLSRVLMHSSFIYLDWKYSNIKKAVVKYNPDILILGNSRLGFIAKEVKKDMPHVHIIGHFDNIEYDYVEGVFAGQSSARGKMSKILEKKVVYRDELDCIKYIDSSMFLTKRDLCRAQELYALDINNPVIVPICIKKLDGELNISNKSIVNLVFLGSLWYRSNVDAIKWFLDNVWSNISNCNENLKLIIAGSNPSKKFLDYVYKHDNVIVHANFGEKKDIIPLNSIFISPIKKGAGMKVKVAEALQMGLTVIGTSESLVGYEEVIGDPANVGIVVAADTAKEYEEAIVQTINYLKIDKSLRVTARDLYERYYSIERAYKDIKSLVNNVC